MTTQPTTKGRVIDTMRVCTESWKILENREWMDVFRWIPATVYRDQDSNHWPSPLLPYRKPDEPKEQCSFELLDCWVVIAMSDKPVLRASRRILQFRVLSSLWSHWELNRICVSRQYWLRMCWWLLRQHQLPCMRIKPDLGRSDRTCTCCHLQAQVQYWCLNSPSCSFSPWAGVVLVS